jgi:hypothetical protein
MDGLHHQFFRVRGAAQEGEIRSDCEFNVTHGTYVMWSSKCSMHEPCRRRAAVDKVPVKSGTK